MGKRSRRLPRELRQLHVRSVQDAMEFGAVLWRRGNAPGTVLAVFLADDDGVVEFQPVDVGDEDVDLAELVYMCCVIARHQTRGRARKVVLFTDRTGEAPPGRPDDELEWMRVCSNAEEAGITAIDWFVVFGSKMYSVAQFAPIPARWAAPVSP